TPFAKCFEPLPVSPRRRITNAPIGSHDATKEYDAARSVVQEIRLGRARRDNTILIQDSAAGAIQLQQKARAARASSAGRSHDRAR
ncbi:hypothetical protein, partial [uncultured Bradyrhizobium sp.]|uniref:hypothetical protein n=1 Tax=uncultured Bradyrhizobium sp. TaxID=199684 RepID=UPI0026107508